ncbi:hypothetical protein [Synechococcus sp. PCC 6312]|uniref:hypothetical protein n=1 Tax=Synechococcus sp. (strain ATCC 27167 / PCC 6312) TaxID=195253 RepID=UPI00029F1751|nr:hypothetical protein [Synechococcus sp. PCC 6312]AFY62790.1 hypothetical protein Syn6312_3780 [Synechococcus sp. PCC 6312]
MTRPIDPLYFFFNTPAENRLRYLNSLSPQALKRLARSLDQRGYEIGNPRTANRDELIARINTVQGHFFADFLP